MTEEIHHHYDRIQNVLSVEIGNEVIKITVLWSDTRQDIRDKINEAIMERASISSYFSKHPEPDPDRKPLVGPRRTEALRDLQPSIQDIRNNFFVFKEELQKRLAKGAQAYGDESFTRPVNDLLVELEQECLDLAGWGFVLWSRLQRLGLAVRESEKEVVIRKTGSVGMTMPETDDHRGCDIDADYHHQRPEED